MSTCHAPPQIPAIRVLPMTQLAEAVDKEDDWTGLTDAAARRRRQNRLNVRAYRRRRKALQAQEHPDSISVSKSVSCVAQTDPGVPCWLEEQQRVFLIPASAAHRFQCNSKRAPLIPKPTASNIMFPLAPDHLITLLQYNVLRACITNRNLISCIKPTVQGDCSSAALHVLPGHPHPHALPPSLHPTALQRTVPHEDWIDIIPDPTWRDNVILALGTFDEDELWADTVGGLFEGFPHSEIEKRGVIAWSPPWNVSGWEASEGFLRKYAWSFKGCDGIIASTNNWRRKRGEEPLVFEI
ncbi:Fc.00g091540.m01.CDS01 [Cosmosporella sp. VM-42]